CEQAARRALHHYRRTGFSTEVCLAMLAAAYHGGPRPVPEAAAECHSLVRQAQNDRAAESSVLYWLACLEAMRGGFGAARESIQRARDIFEELGHRAGLLTDWVLAASEVEMLAGAAQAGEALLRAACESSELAENKAWLATLRALLAEAVYEQGRFD